MVCREGWLDVLRCVAYDQRLVHDTMGMTGP